MALGLGLGLMGRLDLVGSSIEESTDPIQIQCDIDAVCMDLDAHED